MNRFLEVEGRTLLGESTRPTRRLSQIDNVLEKQNDVIRFMRRNNAKLTARVRALTEQVDTLQRGTIAPRER